MDKTTDFESAVIRVDESVSALGQAALKNKDEGLKILEFLISFNPNICDQDDLSVKVRALMGLNGECKSHARIIVEHSAVFGVPIWNSHKVNIQKIKEKWSEIFL